MKQECRESHEWRHCKHGAEEGRVPALSTPQKNRPYCKQRDDPQYCWRSTPNPRHKSPDLLSLHPLSPCPNLSKHLRRRDIQRKQDNLRTTVTPRASEQNDLTSESLGIVLFVCGRPEVTPVPSKTWTCALQTTFMPEEPAFSWIPVIRGLLFSGGSRPLYQELPKGCSRGSMLWRLNTGRQLLSPGRPKPEFQPPHNPWWKERMKSKTYPNTTLPLHTHKQKLLKAMSLNT